MRKIAFRAWDKNAKAWLLPVALAANLGDWFVFNPEVPPAIGVEVMQFTGLLDKNGKEIYEGDLLKYTQVYNLPQEVKMEGGCWVFGDETLGALEDKVEIIGNIYENPELLKV